MGHLTPEQRFFRYAWPCAEKRLIERKMTEAQYRKLRTHQENPHLPLERHLLETCFPQAFDSLRILGNETDREPWDEQNVTEYWHDCHGEPSPVQVYMVEERRGDGTLFASFRNESLLLINPYSLEPERGCRVYVHMRCAIEPYDEV